MDVKLRGAIMRSAKELLSQMDLFELCDVYSNELSGGELRRMSIARALINSPTNRQATLTTIRRASSFHFFERKLTKAQACLLSRMNMTRFNMRIRYTEWKKEYSQRKAEAILQGRAIG